MKSYNEAATGEMVEFGDTYRQWTESDDHPGPGFKTKLFYHLGRAIYYKLSAIEERLRHGER